jgi:hypothetical protein
MLIEYKIRFEEDGVTICQRIEPDGSTEVKKQLAASRPATTTAGDTQVAAQGFLGSSHDQANETSRTTSEPARPGVGGGDGAKTGSGGGDGSKTGSGGGDGGKTGSGGGRPAGLAIVFGPIVIGSSSIGAGGGDGGKTGSGGGDGPKTGTGGPP